MGRPSVETRLRLAAISLGLDPDAVMEMTFLQFAMAAHARRSFSQGAIRAVHDSQRILRTVRARRLVLA
jgi:hypothetical protein